MTIVVFNTCTKEVVAVAPIGIECDFDVNLIEGDGIVKDGFDYIIFNGTQPVLKDVGNGIVALDESKLILDKGYL